MTHQPREGGFWAKPPITPTAIIGGLLVGMVAANIWPLLLYKLGAPVAAAIELVFLGLYVWWFSGAAPGPWKAQRTDLGRGGRLSGAQWAWGLMAAVCFAATVHAAIILVFRFVAFPAAAFHKGYDLAFIPTLSLRWLACVVSALSAGVCEEMGFRGYIQRPIEKRHGATVAIAISSVLFMLLHLNKDWSIFAMTPIVLGAGVLLGVMARAAGSLVFNMLGHWIMDIGLFAFWWTQIGGTFAQRPIFETGLDLGFFAECGLFATVLALLLLAISRLARLRGPELSGPRPEAEEREPVGLRRT
ncbi:MAG TPA: type II CAAX endopeptidase family protein [Caulobacteraceae bacterium]